MVFELERFEREQIERCCRDTEQWIFSTTGKPVKVKMFLLGDRFYREFGPKPPDEITDALNEQIDRMWRNCQETQVNLCKTTFERIMVPYFSVKIIWTKTRYFENVIVDDVSNGDGLITDNFCRLTGEFL